MKKIISILLTIIISSLMLTSCIATAESSTKRLIEVDKGYCHGYSYQIVYDRQTGVEYLHFDDCAAVVLVDQDGKPLIYKGE